MVCVFFVPATVILIWDISWTARKYCQIMAQLKHFNKSILMLQRAAVNSDMKTSCRYMQISQVEGTANSQLCRCTDPGGQNSCHPRQMMHTANSDYPGVMHRCLQNVGQCKRQKIA